MISIVTTVKDGERYIIDTLLSVYRQTYKNYEHIVVDDGSSDDTVTLILQFKAEHPQNNIKVIRTKGVGRGEALNIAVGSAQFPWIAVIDADDLWHPKKLEIQSRYIDSSVSVVATDHRSFSESTPSLEPNNIDTKFSLLNIRDFLVRNSICHSSAIIRKSDCTYNVTRKSQFDLELWLRLSMANKKIIKLNDTLTYHRIHPQQHFESRMGRKMSFNSFKLKSQYALRTKNFVSLFHNALLYISTFVRSK